MQTPSAMLPIALFIILATALPVGMLVAAKLVGPKKRRGAVKDMPYESGMDPIHGTRRRFDVRFHLVAIAFLVFDVELLFLYPWAVASRDHSAAGPEGVDWAVGEHLVSGRGIVFAGVMIFTFLLALGFAYDWKKGVFRWR